MHSGLASPTLVDNNMVTSTWWMHDGSFLRLKTVELGYTFSQKALKKNRRAILTLIFDRKQPADLQ